MKCFNFPECGNNLTHHVLEIRVIKATKHNNLISDSFQVRKDTDVDLNNRSVQTKPLS
jgi:hypothetical protein